MIHNIQQKEENVIIQQILFTYCFPRDIHEVPLKDAKEMHKRKIPVEAISFLKNAGLLIRTREEILNNFKGKIFALKNLEPAQEPSPDPAVFDTPKPTPNKLRNFHLNCVDIFFNKIAQDETNINTETFN